MTAEKDFKSFLHPISLPQNVFLILGLFFGLLFVFVTPPAIVGDEPNHFFRAYQISEGNIFGEKRGNLSGGWIPKSVLYTNRKLVGNIEMNHDVKFDTNLLTELRQIPLNRDDTVFKRFPNTVIYTPIPYIPQVLGITVGKIFDVSALTMIYFARIVNLLFFLALACLAIKKTPVHKWAFCFLGLTPTNVFQVSSASVDAFTYGICFLTISYFLFYAFGEKEKLEKSDVLKILILSLSAVLCKQAYVLLPLLFLLIPSRKLVSIRTYFLTFIGLLVCCLGSVAAWALAIKPIYLPYRIDIPINPDEQTAFIISHPLNYLNILVNDYIIHSGYYFITFFGQLVWFDLYVPTFLTIVLFIVLMAIALTDKDEKIFVPKLSKLLFLVIIVPTLILINTLLYMTWSPIGGEMIEGVQGRYFIPVAPLFFLLFYNKKIKWKFFEDYIYIIVYFTVIISLLITLKTVFDRYYV